MSKPNKTRSVGYLLLFGCPIIMIAYALGLAFYPVLLLQLTAIAAVFVLLGLFMWIGYTTITETSSSVASDVELDNVRAETIYPAHGTPSTEHLMFAKLDGVDIGEGTEVRDHVNLYKCKIGKNCKIESFVYIEEGVTIGDECKVKPNVYIPSGVVIEDQVFLGPNVTFTNDKYPHAKGNWQQLKTIVRKGASIGAHSVILPGVEVGRNAVIGAGSVVTRDVPDDAIVFGNPAKPLTDKQHKDDGHSYKSRLNESQNPND